MIVVVASSCILVASSCPWLYSFLMVYTLVIASSCLWLYHAVGVVIYIQCHDIVYVIDCTGCERLYCDSCIAFTFAATALS
jgi:hypothetical protein